MKRIFRHFCLFVLHLPCCFVLDSEESSEVFNLADRLSIASAIVTRLALLLYIHMPG